jgi:hypothetical protein
MEAGLEKVVIGDGAPMRTRGRRPRSATLVIEKGLRKDWRLGEVKARRTFNFGKARVWGDI